MALIYSRIFICSVIAVITTSTLFVRAPSSDESGPVIEIPYTVKGERTPRLLTVQDGKQCTVVPELSGLACTARDLNLSELGNGQPEVYIGVMKKNSVSVKLRYFKTASSIPRDAIRSLLVIRSQTLKANKRFYSKWVTLTTQIQPTRTFQLKNGAICDICDRRQAEYILDAQVDGKQKQFKIVGNYGLGKTPQVSEVRYDEARGSFEIVADSSGLADVRKGLALVLQGDGTAKLQVYKAPPRKTYLAVLRFGAPVKLTTGPFNRHALFVSGAHKLRIPRLGISLRREEMRGPVIRQDVSLSRRRHSGSSLPETSHIYENMGSDGSPLMEGMEGSRIYENMGSDGSPLMEGSRIYENMGSDGTPFGLKVKQQAASSIDLSRSFPANRPALRPLPVPFGARGARPAAKAATRGSFRRSTSEGALFQPNASIEEDEKAFKELQGKIKCQRNDVQPHLSVPSRDNRDDSSYANAIIDSWISKGIEVVVLDFDRTLVANGWQNGASFNDASAGKPTPGAEQLIRACQERKVKVWIASFQDHPKKSSAESPVEAPLYNKIRKFRMQSADRSKTTVAKVSWPSRIVRWNDLRAVSNNLPRGPALILKVLTNSDLSFTEYDPIKIVTFLPGKHRPGSLAFGLNKTFHLNIIALVESVEKHKIVLIDDNALNGADAVKCGFCAMKIPPKGLELDQIVPAV